MPRTAPKSRMDADYLQGDPTEPGPITGGTLTIRSGGLVFSSPGEAELIIGIEELEGITVSGARSGATRSDRRGTTRVAANRGDQRAVLEFAIDRANGVALRERLNRARAGIGRPPLPFVEALYEFESALPGRAVPQRPVADGNGNGKGSRNGAVRGGAHRRNVTPTAVVNGGDPNTAILAEAARVAALKTTGSHKVYRDPPSRGTVIATIIAIAVAIEIVVTLLVLFVF